MRYKLLAAAVCAAMTSQVQGATPYVLEELGNIDNAKHAYVTDMNEAGQAIGVAGIPFDIKIDITALDFDDDNSLKSAYDVRERYFESIDEEITFTLEDIENGVINGDAQSFLQDFLRGNYSNSRYQKISGNSNSEFNLAIDYSNPSAEVRIYDVESADYEGLTRSVENMLNGITDDGVKVGWGSAPYEKLDFTPNNETESETHYIRDFTRRAFVMSNTAERIELTPTEATYGGISIASDIVKITDGYLVSGEMSVSIAPDSQEALDDNCDNEDVPEAVCQESYVTSTNRALYNRHATLWHLDNQFNVTNVEDLGIGIEPDEDEAKDAWNSMALAVNENEIAVGYSVVRYRDGDDIAIYPVYFKDGSVVEFIDEQEYRPGGRAVAINRSNVITGYAVDRIEGVSRTKFFHHNIETGATTFPADFFKSSSSVANDINDNGLIVGQGEVETTSSSNRRREGFLYNINTEIFTNINDLLPCYASDGETLFPYVVAEAIGINNDGTIYGAATKTVDKRDAQGNVVVDANGNVEQESVVVAVKLTYNENGVAEPCPDKAQETYERQGAAINPLAFILIPLIALRRRYSNKK